MFTAEAADTFFAALGGFEKQPPIRALYLTAARLCGILDDRQYASWYSARCAAD